MFFLCCLYLFNFTNVYLKVYYAYEWRQQGRQERQMDRDSRCDMSQAGTPPQTPHQLPRHHLQGLTSPTTTNRTRDESQAHSVSFLFLSFFILLIWIYIKIDYNHDLVQQPHHQDHLYVSQPDKWRWQGQNGMDKDGGWARELSIPPTSTVCLFYFILFFLKRRLHTTNDAPLAANNGQGTRSTLAADTPASIDVWIVAARLHLFKFYVKFLFHFVVLLNALPSLLFLLFF